MSESADLAVYRNRGLVKLTFERADQPADSVTAATTVSIRMTDVADVSGSNSTSIGFQLVDASGGEVRSAVLVEIACFDEASMVVPSENAIMGGASAGTIIGGGSSNAMVVRTSANGAFACSLVNPYDSTVYLSCSPTFGGPVIDCQDFESVTFSA